MPLLTKDEAMEVSDAFLWTLYGEEIFVKWKQLKSHLNFIREREFVQWLIEAGYQTLSSGSDHVTAVKEEHKAYNEDNDQLKVEKGEREIQHSYYGQVEKGEREIQHSYYGQSETSSLIDDQCYYQNHSSRNIHQKISTSTETIGTSSAGITSASRDAHTPATCTQTDQYKLVPPTSCDEEEDDDDIMVLSGDEDIDSDLMLDAEGTYPAAQNFPVPIDLPEVSLSSEAAAAAGRGSGGSSQGVGSAQEGSIEQQQHTETSVRSSSGGNFFPCPQCPHMSNSNYKLQRHIAGVHQRLKPYDCPYCSYKCSQHSHLKGHLVLAHGLQSPNKCGRCNKFLPTPSSLRKHQERCSSQQQVT